MRLCIHQRERRTPRPTEDKEPFIYLQMLAQGLDIGDEVLGRVFSKFAAGRGLAGAALVEEDNAIVEWVEVDGAREGGAASWAAVEEDDLFQGLAEVRVAAEVQSYLAFHLHFRIVRSGVCGWCQQAVWRNRKALNGRSRALVSASRSVRLWSTPNLFIRMLAVTAGSRALYAAPKLSEICSVGTAFNSARFYYLGRADGTCDGLHSL